MTLPVANLPDTRIQQLGAFSTVKAGCEVVEVSQTVSSLTTLMNLKPPAIIQSR